MEKSKTTGKEEEDAETLAAQPNIAAVANLTLFLLWIPGSAGLNLLFQSYTIRVGNYLFEENLLL